MHEFVPIHYLPQSTYNILTKDDYIDEKEMTQIFTSPNLDEEEGEYDEIYIKKEHKIFKVIYYKDLSLFTNIEIDLKEALIDSKKFRIKTHSSERQARFTYNDNMRTVIKRRFFNTYLINALNEKL